ncbi:reverse transcriptase-rnase h-integrase [Moniliophthora roreri MCA 2997]|uniref:Reverse transcriptase-rnase h-integrase n=1 Tax=Moniliophthora roreri (strain MCA 2997) TaxID=1381753 RepID=V2WP54_MONRO|nr:reverse transcriptase-rnase h-integrase [Moniliophthora roreri MCA 2997]
MASQEMAHQQQQVKKDIDEHIPFYLQGYRDCFEKGKLEYFPSSWTYDHMIELQSDFMPQNCKLYPLSPAEQIKQDKFLEENLQKGYIQKSKSPMASLFFFVAKKGERSTETYTRLLRAEQGNGKEHLSVTFDIGTPGQVERSERLH